MAQELPQRIWSKTTPRNCLHSASPGFAATAKTAKEIEKKHCCSRSGMRIPKKALRKEHETVTKLSIYFHRFCWGFCCCFPQEEIIKRLNLDTSLPLTAASATTTAPSWSYNSKRPRAKMHQEFSWHQYISAECLVSHECLGADQQYRYLTVTFLCRQCLTGQKQYTGMQYHKHALYSRKNQPGSWKRGKTTLNSAIVNILIENGHNYSSLQIKIWTDKYNPLFGLKFMSASCWGRRVSINAEVCEKMVSRNLSSLMTDHYVYANHCIANRS